jgi:hypothetical protein
MLPFSGGGKTPTQLGPLERANLNHWTLHIYNSAYDVMAVLYDMSCIHLVTSTSTANFSVFNVRDHVRFLFLSLHSITSRILTLSFIRPFYSFSLSKQKHNRLGNHVNFQHFRFSLSNNVGGVGSNVL